MTKPGSQADRRKALGLAISQIEKQLGKGSIMRMGTDSPRVKVAAIPTGAINLDAATGVGGIPRGRITEIYGPESSGKTTLTLHLAANVQKAGGVAAYVDAEHALDIDYAKKLGVDIENLLVSQPDTGEQALEIVEILVRSGAVDIVVIDSVAALVPKAEIEGEMGESHMGLQARLMSQALRKLAGSINRSNCAVVFINQLREKIGVMFGNPETTTGGKALKFYASLRLDIRRIGPVKERETVVGNHVRVKVVKNKVAPPFRQAEFDIMFDEGISHTSLLVDLAAEANIIQKSGAWYSYGDQRIGQGRENAKLFLRDNPVAHGRSRGKGEGAPRHAGSRGRWGRRRNGRIVHGACLDSYGDRSRPAPPGCGSVSKSTVSGLGRFPASSWAAEGLAVGRPVDAELQQRLGAAADLEAAFRTVLRCLELRAYARNDLGRRLVRKGHPRHGGGGGARAGRWSGPAGRCRICPELRADSSGARAGTVTAHSRPPGHGGPAIAHRSAHSPPNGRREATASSMPLALATKRAAQLGALPRQVKRRRVLAYLARRGFSREGGRRTSSKAWCRL